MLAGSPLVTLVLPIHNESRYIAACLDAVLSQDYPSDRMEILIVDGMSDDGTREIVQQFIANHRTHVLSAVEGTRPSHPTTQPPNFRFLDNPERIVPTALNRGIRAARGDVIIRVDGHAVIARDYVRCCIESLDGVDADCVGGPIHTIGETWIARGIALAQSSPFGVGSAAFRYASTPQYVDTLAFGGYGREVFDRIGLFDEELVRNQDDEFNFRLIRAGGKIWLDPEIRSTYYSRSTLHGLWKQYFEYGFWKVRVIQKHGRPASWRHLVPGAFVLVVATSALVSFLTRNPVWFAVVALPYLFASLFASAVTTARNGWRYLPLLPLAFTTMHLAYGIGFLAGIIHFGLLKHAHPPRSPQSSIKPGGII